MSSFKDDMSSLDAVSSSDYYGNSSESKWLGDSGLNFENYENSTLLTQRSDNRGVFSTSYLWFGKVGATMKSSRGSGVSTSFSLFSNLQDTVAFNFNGSDLNSVMTSYSYLGSSPNKDVVEVEDTFGTWHDYEFDWSEDEISWMVDGKVVRKLSRKDTWNETSKKYEFPSNPARIGFNVYPTDQDSYKDTDDYKEYGYNYAFVKNVSVEASGLPSFVKDHDESKYKAYTYNSRSGDREAVELTDAPTLVGEAGGFGPDSPPDTKHKSSSSEPFSMSKLTTLADDERVSSKTAESTSSEGTDTGSAVSESTNSENTGSAESTESASSSTSSGSAGTLRVQYLRSFVKLFFVGALMV